MWCHHFWREDKFVWFLSVICIWPPFHRVCQCSSARLLRKQNVGTLISSFGQQKLAVVTMRLYSYGAFDSAFRGLSFIEYFFKGRDPDLLHVETLHLEGAFARWFLAHCFHRLDCSVPLHEVCILRRLKRAVGQQFRSANETDVASTRIINLMTFKCSFFLIHEVSTVGQHFLECNALWHLSVLI